jgi:hypothetical protein
MAYEIIDDFLPKEEFKELQKFMFSDYMPWFYNDGVITPHDGHYQFVHKFLYDGVSSNMSWLLNPIIEKLKPSMVYRLKANLGMRTEKNIEQGYHVDLTDFECKTAVLYLNTNNGYTVFENGEKVYSVENRLVIFDSQMAHSGATQTDTHVRILINLNFDL